MSKNDTMVVLTSKSIETMIQEGGCGHWRASARSIKSCRYIVATRNKRSSWTQGEEDHGAAFLIGEISGAKAENKRFVIEMSRFARVNVKKVWTPGGANPVHYERVESLGIDLKNVKWEPWPTSEVGFRAESSAHPLSIADAKRGLARTFGVEPEQIEIVIKG
jgi:hypothetical protein